MINVVPSSPILVTLMMDSLSSSGTSVLTRATWRNIPEHGILQKQRYLLLMSSWNVYYEDSSIDARFVYRDVFCHLGTKLHHLF
jgi:hypothetical protein